MKSRIKKLEQTARQLEPTAEKRENWNKAVQNYADNFLNNLEQLPAYDHTTHEGAALHDIPIGVPLSMEALLHIQKRDIDGTGINAASGGHFGYVPGGGVFGAALGDYLAAVTNNYAGIYFGNPGGVRLENHLLKWMCELVGFPKTALGNLTSGGSIANLIAITVARDRANVRSRDIENCVIYLTHQVHHCVQKSLRIAGFREAIIRYIAMDESFKMKVAELEQQVLADQKAGLKPFMIVASAGTTDVGAIDPLFEIGELANREKIWFHIDAAYGGFFRLAEVKNEDGSTVKEKLVGMKTADSIAIDPHKGLFLPYGSGAILMKDVTALYNSFHYLGNYMQDALVETDQLNPADLSPELTKHFRGMRMWMPLQLHGIEPFKAALEEKILLTRYFYEEVQKLGFEVGPFPDLSIMIYRFVPETGDANAFNQALVQGVKMDGRVFVSSTNIDGIFWIRLAISCFRTHLREIDLYLAILKELVASLKSTNIF